MDFKVRCVGYNGYEKLFTIGKVYDVKNNRICSDAGYSYNHWSNNLTFDELYEWFKPWYEFELVVEDKIVITTDGKTTTATLYNGTKKKTVATAICSPEDEFDFMTGATIAMERLEKELKLTQTKLKIEFGKKYKLKSWDSVEDHHGITKPTWENIVDYPVVAREKKGYATGSWICDTNFCELIFTLELIEREWDDTKDGLYNGKVVCVDSGNCSKNLTVGKIYTIVDGMGKNERGTFLTNNPVKNIDDLNSKFVSIKFIELVED